MILINAQLFIRYLVYHDDVTYMTDKIFIVDTTVFIAGYILNNLKGTDVITVPEVVNELSDDKKLFLERALNDNLRIEPSKIDTIEYVKDVARNTGDINKLSDTDISLIAKAIEYSKKKDVVILSDDYAIQNVCSKIGIKSEGIIQRGIKEEIIWKKKCTGCKRIYDMGDICPICGSDLKIKVVKKYERN